VDPKALKMLMRYSWPGNVRELERCLEHAFVFVKGPVIFAHYLPQLHYAPPSQIMAGQGSSPMLADLKPPLDRTSLVQALEKCGGRRKEAAGLLGISRTSMWRRMKRHGLL
jgi:DNA-binding NtrC family response regulator